MPSFCAVDTCKRVKQIGDDVSFHKFPLNRSALLKKWINFVQPQSKDKSKRITKYSSICSLHFHKSDFSTSSQARKFLNKNAVPSIIQHVNSSANVSHHTTIYNNNHVEAQVELEDPLYALSLECGLCLNKEAHIQIADENHISLIRKCLPILAINIYGIQRICYDCLTSLKTFSCFIDKIINSQSNIEQYEDDENFNNCANIKVEPISNYDEEKLQSFELLRPVIPSRLTMPFTPQKKCEILEIVDIKPLLYDHSQQDTYDEDDIRILSPRPLKVELPDDDGNNEMEQIEKYMFITSVFLQDHNYAKKSVQSEVQPVKTEFIENPVEFVQETRKFIMCNFCKKTFNNFKKYLSHKMQQHQPSLIKRSLQFIKFYKKWSSKKNDQRKKRMKIKCTKIIQRHQKRVNVAKENQIRRKSNTNKIHQCKICLKVFCGSKNLYQHKLSHAGVKYKCPQEECNKKFKRLHGCRQHYQAYHLNQKPHICPICNHRYALKGDMKRCRHSSLKIRSFENNNNNGKEADERGRHEAITTQSNTPVTGTLKQLAKRTDITVYKEASS